MAREIIVLDGNEVPNPEDMAMLLAMYSRDPRSVMIHLAKVREVGSGKFNQQYYVGYGHRSIGDCGTTTVCVENVSMLAAKAIQDSALYNGQEASTRYLDMSRQALWGPLEDGTSNFNNTANEGPRGLEIHERWMALYKKVLASLIESFKLRFPIKEGEKTSDWEKAIKAKAFDVARGFLPAGIETYVGWHTTLRHANDHLKLMRHHPSREIAAISDLIHNALYSRYKSSFGHKRYEADEAYVAQSMSAFAYWNGPEGIHDFSAKSRLELNELRPFDGLLRNRPAKSELHPRFRQFGTITYAFPLDFGSFRDLQRQRSAVQEMPLLTTNYGFHPWYLEQLPDDLAYEVMPEIETIVMAIDKLDASSVDKQYYTAMGFVVPNKITCTLPSAVYIAELRAGQTVHPTLRKPAQQIGEDLRSRIPGIAMHHDMTADAWSVKRGQQDIVKKEVV